MPSPNFTWRKRKKEITAPNIRLKCIGLSSHILWSFRHPTNARRTNYAHYSGSSIRVVIDIIAVDFCGVFFCFLCYLAGQSLGRSTICRTISSNFRIDGDNFNGWNSCKAGEKSRLSLLDKLRSWSVVDVPLKSRLQLTLLQNLLKQGQCSKIIRRQNSSHFLVPMSFVKVFHTNKRSDKCKAHGCCAKKL